MSFFNYYPETIFVPLASPNQRLYLGLIIKIHTTFFSEDVDFIETTIPVQKIKYLIEDFITNNKWVDEEDFKYDLAHTEAIKSASQYVYQSLCKNGWLSLHKDGVKQEIYISPLISKLIDFFINVNKSEEVGVDVLSVYANLNSLLKETHKFTSSDVTQLLDKVQTEAKNMARKMRNLALYLTDLSQDFKAKINFNEKAEVFFEGFIKNSSFSDFESFKGKNHPLRFKSEIIDMTYQLEGDNLYEHLTNALIESKGLDRLTAKEHITKSIRDVRNIFNNTDELIKKIDRSHSKLLNQVVEISKYQQRTHGAIAELLEKTIYSLSKSEESTIKSPLNWHKPLGAQNLSKVRSKRIVITSSIKTLTKVNTKEKIRLINARRAIESKKFINENKYLQWLDGLFATHNGKKEIDSITIASSIESLDELTAFLLSSRLIHAKERPRNKYQNTLKKYSFKFTSDDLIEHHLIYCRSFIISVRD